MTSEQIKLIRETFAGIASRAELAALLFYKRLFELGPSLRPLFRGSIEAQGAKLTQMLAAAVRLLDKPESLVPVLEDLGRRHAGYGVRDEHYDTVGTALLWMLAEILRPKFTTEAREAWAALYDIVASTMKRAVEDAPEVTPAFPLHSRTAAAAP